ncbi:MAG: dihydroneopterin aldolase [Clostridiales bacterium]|nr:dihydroneopterin aldolase [Clostridiales bacterium]
MDSIIIKDLKIYAYHGVNPEEKTQGQLFSFDIKCNLSLEKPCISDDVEDTVNYAKVIKCVKKTAIGEKNNLLERVCRRVADALLSEFESIDSVTIRMKKPEAPISADFDYVAVEIERRRQ